MNERMLLLETSGLPGQVGLAIDGQLVDSRTLDAARLHARDLAPAIAALLREQGWKAADVQTVAVSLGPGSYTGLRIGIMSAKTLAYATGCRLIGVETTAVIARGQTTHVPVVDVLIDAQKENIYVQSFQRSAGSWQATSTLRLVAFGDWLAERQANSWIAGPALRKFAERIPDREHMVGPEFWEPSLAALLHCSLEKSHVNEWWDLEPLYLRPSSAEEQWQKRIP